MRKVKLLSIVVPVFNETAVIDAFYARLKHVMDSLVPLSYEILFVDDGSRDDTHDKLIGLAAKDKNIRVIKFSRNFGHQVAITAGIDIAIGDALVVIDSDLQDPPEVIKDFIGKWEQGYDVVYGIRKKRKGESRLKLITANLFYRILRTLIKIDIPLDAGDFRLINRRVVEHFKRFKENDRFVRGLTSWLGFNQTGVFYDRDERYAGETKYPYRKMIKFALDGITSFSSIPLKLASWLGYLTSIFAFLYACIVLIQKILGFTVQGWATIMVGMLFLGGVQLICLGIIGEYIGRIFCETKRRPLYVIDHIYSAESVTSIGENSDRLDRSR
jgi:dolichol-phosphate mannosyltransferase